MKKECKGSPISMLIASLLVVDAALDLTDEQRKLLSVDSKKLESMRLLIMILIENSFSTTYAQLYSNKSVQVVADVLDIRAALNALICSIASLPEEKKLQAYFYLGIDERYTMVTLPKSKVVELGILLHRRLANDMAAELIVNEDNSIHLENLSKALSKVTELLPADVILYYSGKMEAQELEERISGLCGEVSALSANATRLFSSNEELLERFDLKKILKRVSR